MLIFFLTNLNMKINKLEEAKIKKLKKLLNEGSIDEIQYKIARRFFRELYSPNRGRLEENKTSQLKKLLNAGNINEDQFKTADKFFKDHNSFEKEIDWNKGLKITWDDLEKVIKKERGTESQTKKKIRKGLEGFKEGEDYVIVGEGSYEGKPWVAYQPFSWESSRMIASHYVEPSKNANSEIDDADWCTAYQKDKTYWDMHDKIEAFLYICGESVPSKKVAISISEKEEDASGSRFLYSLDNLNFNIWDFDDYNDTIEEDELLEVVPNLYDLIRKAYDNWANKAKEGILSKLKLNPDTNRYDYDGNLDIDDLKLFVSDDKNGFTINFGEVTGSFGCYELGLKSLKGAPKAVGGYFNCTKNRLTSLEGAPESVGNGFYCSGNQLTSLEGAPQIVGGFFNCRGNSLASLEGAPQIVDGDFDCSVNELISLKGAPRNVSKIFDCSWNSLTSLEGSPQTVGGSFDCSHNQLASLKGCPQTIEGNFYCGKNPDLQSLEGIGEVKRKIYKDF